MVIIHRFIVEKLETDAEEVLIHSMGFNEFDEPVNSSVLNNPFQAMAKRRNLGFGDADEFMFAMQAYRSQA